jgi:hypothetical protein
MLEGRRHASGSLELNPKVMCLRLPSGEAMLASGIDE